MKNLDPESGDDGLSKASSSRNLSVTHIVSSVDAEAAGTTYAVTRLSQSLAALKGTRVKVLSLGTPERCFKAGVELEKFKRDYTWATLSRKLGISSDMRKHLKTDKSDVFHVHGLWMMPNIYPAKIASRVGRPLVLSPHGMLGATSLTYSRLQKRAFWTLFQRAAVNAATCFHATAESELEDIRSLGFRQPVAVVPNGVDFPEIDDGLRESQNGSRYALALGRIHPIKGLDRLITAWALIADDNRDWKLRIVGPDDVGYAGQLRTLIAAVGLEERVSIEKPVYGKDKASLMREASIFVLPSLYENFAITVAESLAVGTPVIATIGAPWAGLAEHDCGWWIDHGPAPMASALREAMALSDSQRKLMGARGRIWMNQDFEWKNIGVKMSEVYTWLLGQREQPEYIY